MLPGDEHNVARATDGLWELLDHMGPGRRPALLRGDVAWGVEPVMARAEQEGLAYLFRLRMTANVRRALTKSDGRARLDDAGHGWQGKETTLRLVGWSRHRRVVLLRRKLDRPLVLVDHRAGRAAAADLCRDRARQRGVGIRRPGHLAGQRDPDAGPAVSRSRRLRERVRRTEEPVGWGGFTTHDLKRCRLLAGSVALIFNWWSLFVRLADPEHHREAITSRPLLLQAIARQTQHAGQVTLTISSTHGERDKARHAYLRIAGFLAGLRQTAEQLDPVQRWYRILSEALRRYLKGRQLEPPLRLNPG